MPSLRDIQYATVSSVAPRLPKFFQKNKTSVAFDDALYRHTGKRTAKASVMVATLPDAHCGYERRSGAVSRRLLSDVGLKVSGASGGALAVVAYREGWEAVLFLLIFLAIWQLASIGPAGDF
jgi:hypothetical protein